MQRGLGLARIAQLLALLSFTAFAQEPIQVGFLWHMHQPIYYPYESPSTVDANGRYSFSVVDVHNQRLGPYTNWPKDALGYGLGQPHLGAQVSFSGSLIENLNALKAAGVGGGQWSGWDGGYDTARAWLSALGNRRLDLVAFGHHHPLMPLLDELDIRMQIRLHKYIYEQTFGTGYSLGMFPPETAFSTRIIPALAAEGVQWVLVDNIHFDRACVGYPYTSASNLYPPNPADQINPDPATDGGAWVQLSNLWAPSRVSAPFGYQPHYAQHVNPDTGGLTRMVVVPAARYEGNEDGRGGYGAFLYDQVMDQYINFNTDPDHPMFVVLHHDGDNFGGGSESYYHHNFQNMVNWVSADPDYEVSTVQDYLERFPPDVADVIHVESGAWAGADNGDPEFKKWLSDPDATGWSPDRNSWAVMTAARNRVHMAETIAPAVSTANILSGVGTNTEKAWRWLLVGQASDYWYWDGSAEPWDSNVTRACNQAVIHADLVIAGASDTVAPSLFPPQRDPYNPGGFEWASTPEPSDFAVWTYAYDVSGLAGVTLRWRVDNDGFNPLESTQNETFAGGSEVGAWQSVTMIAQPNPPRPAHILAPTYIATKYQATIAGQTDVLIDYYVEATDHQGNVRKSDIAHVYVGLGDAGGGGERVAVTPDPPPAGGVAAISYDPAGGPLSGASAVFLHYGFNNWTTVISPDPAMTWDTVAQRWTLEISIPATATQLDVVFNNGAGVWDNNNGADWHFAVDGASLPGWTMDGVLDAGACPLSGGAPPNNPVCLLASNAGVNLWAGIVGDTLYVATNDAGEGFDHFIYVARTPGALQTANWAKAGQIAAWDAYLADENANDYESWFDAVGTRLVATGANGGVLEGTLNLREEFGSLPGEIHLAVAHFGDGDGGALRWLTQVPASVNFNGNVDASEYLLVDLVALAGASEPCPGDADEDGDVDLTDLGSLLSNYGVLSGATRAQGDLDGDGDVDLSDLGELLAAFGEPC